MDQKQDKSATMISQGIEALIEQLKENGVKAGKDAAEKLIAAAQIKANEILNNAQAKSKAILDEAHQTILQEKKATEDALRLAARNMRLELRQNLIDRFTQEVNRIVHKELDNEAMLRQLILLIAGDTAKQLQAFNAEQCEIILPERILDFEEIRKNPDLMNKDPLKELIQSLTHKMLKNGMSSIINPDAKKPAGIKVHLIDENIVLDLSEEAVSALLIKHMQPRFRALLEGLLQ
jgi:V/A-type H+-transporting ATPase subunit E